MNFKCGNGKTKMFLNHLLMGFLFGKELINGKPSVLTLKTIILLKLNYKRKIKKSLSFVEANNGLLLTCRHKCFKEAGTPLNHFLRAELAKMSNHQVNGG